MAGTMGMGRRWKRLGSSSRAERETGPWRHERHPITPLRHSMDGMLFPSLSLPTPQPPPFPLASRGTLDRQSLRRLFPVTVTPPMEEGGEFARSTRLSNGTPSSGLGVVLGTITEELESSRPSSPESPARRSSWSDARSPVRRLSCEVSGGGGAADIDARRGQPELVDSACALLLAVDEAATLVACLDADLRRDAKESDDARRRHAVECALLQRRLDDAVAQVWHAWLRSIF